METLEIPHPANGSAQRGEEVIRVRGLTAGFAEANVIEGLDLDVYRGEILGVVGASGTGKTVLLRTILGLIAKRAGTIEIFGVDLEKASARQREAIRLLKRASAPKRARSAAR